MMWRRIFPTAALLMPASRFKCRCSKKRAYKNFEDRKPSQSYWSSIEWFYIPAGLGFSVICYIQLKHIWQRRKRKDQQEANTDEEHYIFKPWQVNVLKKLPTRTLSGLWGYVCDCYVPIWMRYPLFQSYSYVFGCHLEEALVEDVRKYETFNKFFTRQLKPNVRDICAVSCVVSPADCKVISCGVLNSDMDLDQVKGIKYPLRLFLGPRHPIAKDIASITYASPPSEVSITASETPPHSTQSDCASRAYFCTLYLGPGDYHWFHSPVDWTIDHRRHIPGHLFSVNPRALSSVPGIFNLNERVLLSGRWQHGSMMMAAVGAYNVGSIRLDLPTEGDLKTNNFRQREAYSDRLYAAGKPVKRGDVIGRFELGSSIVLVFSAPSDFRFAVKPGDKLKYGQSLGTCKFGSIRKESG